MTHHLRRFAGSWILPLVRARYVHTRLRTHAESVAFFGGDDVEGDICAKQYGELVAHQKKYLSAQWTHSIFDDFIIKQLPPIVTWVLTFAYVIRLAKVKDIYSDNGGQVSRKTPVAKKKTKKTIPGPHMQFLRLPQEPCGSDASIFNSH